MSDIRVGCIWIFWWSLGALMRLQWETFSKQEENITKRSKQLAEFLHRVKHVLKGAIRKPNFQIWTLDPSPASQHRYPYLMGLTQITEERTNRSELSCCPPPCCLSNCRCRKNNEMGFQSIWLRRGRESCRDTELVVLRIDAHFLTIPHLRTSSTSTSVPSLPSLCAYFYCGLATS